ncbi:hypothetical protein BJ170DRAFT_435292 [Xylariales sp. AK1849]|nr:hypothetical protein BJ170DRAFT_435292 [Xylariales sp. AK1849]
MSNSYSAFSTDKPTLPFHQPANIESSAKSMKHILYELDFTNRDKPLDMQRNASLTSWRDLVKQYSGLSLTEPSDRLVACQGFMRDFERRLRWRLSFGLLEPVIMDELTWQRAVDSRPAQRISVQKVGVPQTPTWAWGSIQSTICYPINSYMTFTSKGFAATFDGFVQRIVPSSQTSKQAIRLNGVLFRLKELQTRVDGDLHGRFWCPVSEIYNPANRDSWISTSPSMDVSDGDLQLPFAIPVLDLQPEGGGLWALLLKEVGEGVAEDTFERVGSIVLHHEAADSRSVTNMSKLDHHCIFII